jgi:hypothetical protein
MATSEVYVTRVRVGRALAMQGSERIFEVSNTSTQLGYFLVQLFSGHKYKAMCNGVRD